MKKQTISILVIVLGLILIAVYAELITSGRDIFNINESLNTTENKVETLNFIHWTSFPQKLIRDFSRKYPQVKVEFEQINLNMYSDFQRVRISSGENIDVMGVSEGDYGRFVNNGYLRDLSGMELLHNYSQESMNELKEMLPQGGIYSIPYKSWIVGIWYNKTLFSKYNIEIPADIDSFMNVCAKLKSKNVLPLLMGFRDDSMSSVLYYVSILNAGGEDQKWTKKLAEGTVSWSGDRMFEASKYIDKIISDGYISENAINLTYQQAFSEFLKGRSAMCLSGDWSVELCEQNSDKFIELGVFALPYNSKEVKQRTPGVKAGYLTGIYAKSKNITNSENFLDYISEPYIANLYSEETGTHTNIIAAKNHGKYDYLWEDLRKQEFITPISVYLNSDKNIMLNKSVKEYIVDKKSITEVFKELAEK